MIEKNDMQLNDLDLPGLYEAAHHGIIFKSEVEIRSRRATGMRTVRQYEILEKLGEGGMGVVWKARDTRLDRFAAIKFLPAGKAAEPERRRRFVQEAKTASALNHPGIVTIYDIDQSEGEDFIAMEFVPGKTLDQLIPRKGLRLSEALKYAIQIVDALSAAHAAGIVHRDLKPANVMVTETGQTRVLDFGLAKLTEKADISDEETIRLVAKPNTEEGVILGTVSYMSPEQTEGRKVDARSDIFSFGCLLYEMLTGRRAFLGDSGMSTMAAILNKEPEPIDSQTDGVPRDLIRIVQRCLRKDPERRFQTSSDLRVALEEFQEELSSGQIATAPASPVRRRPPYVLWGGMAAALILLAGGFAWFRPRHAAAPAVLRQLTSEAGMALMPALSPDGKLLVYASDRGANGELDLWLKQVSGGEAVSLVSGMGSVSEPQFSPDGTRVYFLSSGNEVYDVSALGGTPRKLFDSAGPFSVSSKGAIVLLRPRTGGLPGPMTVIPPGGSPSPWRPECVANVVPAWSPDGTELVFPGRCNNVSGLYRASLSNGTVKNIASPVRMRYGPAYSRIIWYRLADGREGVIFSAAQGDATNLFRLSLDGNQKAEPITYGTGFETVAAVSPAGQVVFTRAENTPTVWSLPLSAKNDASDRPRREATEAIFPSPSHDGKRLVFGRVLGPTSGEIVSRDMTTGAETVLATNDLRNPVGNLWNTLSPDESRVAYRVVGMSGPLNYVVSTAGGVPKAVQAMTAFNLPSDWFPDGKRVLGECSPTPAGLCAMDPVTGETTKLLKDPKGELLYPTFSWDGKWLAFMRRRNGLTAIYATPVRNGTEFAGEAEWVEISPPGATASRPHFAPDGNGIFYLLNEKGVWSLVRQDVDSATKHPRGTLVHLLPVQIFPATLAYSIGSNNPITGVSRERVYFSSVEVRSNVWMTSIE